jgi:imidazolonepropionase
MAPTKAILITGAKQLLTLYGPSGPRRGPAMRNLGVIPDGALLVVDGIIQEVGPSRRVENLAAARRAVEISADGRVVMPGFVDSHTHLVCGPPCLTEYEMRIAGANIEEVAEAGLRSTVRALRRTSTQRLEFEARKRIKEFIRHGTTTIEAKSGLGLDETTELKTLRVLMALHEKPLDVVPTYMGAHATPPEFATTDAYIDWMCSHMLPKIRRRKLARFVDVNCGAFAEDQVRRYLERARALGFAVKVHADRFSHGGGVRLAIEQEAVSVGYVKYADEADAGALARSPTIATLLPGPVFHLRLDRYAPARMLIDRGAAVALATGFDASGSPTCSMPMILSLACSQMRMTPAEAITAATINGAHALRRANTVGSLEHGKDADLIMLNVSDYRELPYHFGVNLLAMIMKRGEVLFPRMEFPWTPKK